MDRATDRITLFYRFSISSLSLSSLVKLSLFLSLSDSRESSKGWESHPYPFLPFLGNRSQISSLSTENEPPPFFPSYFDPSLFFSFDSPVSIEYSRGGSFHLTGIRSLSCILSSSHREFDGYWIDTLPCYSSASTTSFPCKAPSTSGFNGPLFLHHPWNLGVRLITYTWDAIVVVRRYFHEVVWKIARVYSERRCESL